MAGQPEFDSNVLLSVNRAGRDNGAARNAFRRMGQ
jgi:hypothetical protein